MANDRPIRGSGTTNRGGFLTVTAAAILVLTVAPAAGAVDGSVPLVRGGTAQPADATAMVSGTLSPAARRALARGPLPAGAGDLSAKAAADAAVRANVGAEPGDSAAAAATGAEAAPATRPTILPPGDF